MGGYDGSDATSTPGQRISCIRLGKVLVLPLTMHSRRVLRVPARVYLEVCPDRDSGDLPLLSCCCVALTAAVSPNISSSLLKPMTV